MLFLFFMFQAVTTLRHVPLWTIIGLNFLFRCINYFYQDVSKVKLGPERFRLVNKFFLIGVLIIMTADFGFSLYDASHVSEKKFYPKKAIEYLKNKNFEGEIFSHYGWGGYLIWKLPEKKVFIDGRMPSWRWNRNLPHESNYAMEDYLAISEGEVNYKDVFQKYNVDTVLLPVEKRETFFNQLDKKFKKFLGRFYKKKIDFT